MASFSWKFSSIISVNLFSISLLNFSIQGAIVIMPSFTHVSMVSFSSLNMFITAALSFGLLTQHPGPLKD